jgi:hypothetical protein
MRTAKNQIGARRVKGCANGRHLTQRVLGGSGSPGSIFGTRTCHGSRRRCHDTSRLHLPRRSPSLKVNQKAAACSGLTHCHL